MPNDQNEKSILKEIKELVERNSKSIQEMQKQIKFVYRYLFWQRVWRIIKVIIIIAVILVGIFYLPPLIQKAVSPYMQLFQELTGQQKELFQKLQKLPGAGIIFDQQKINVK